MRLHLAASLPASTTLIRNHVSRLHKEEPPAVSRRGSLIVLTVRSDRSEVALNAELDRGRAEIAVLIGGRSDQREGRVRSEHRRPLHLGVQEGVENFAREGEV